MIVRPLEEHDIETVSDIIYRAITITNAPDYHADVIEYQSQIFTQGWIRDRMKRRYMVVAVDNGEVVGTGSFADGEMMSIYVDPDKERKGAGRTIMDHLERYAKHEGYDQVHLGSSRTAIKFYERLGYQLYEEVSWEVAGHEVIGYQMRKNLN